MTVEVEKGWRNVESCVPNILLLSPHVHMSCSLCVFSLRNWFSSDWYGSLASGNGEWWVGGRVLLAATFLIRCICVCVPVPVDGIKS